MTRTDESQALANRQRSSAWGADLPQTEDEARARLLEAAEACFAERGPSRTKITHVAAVAGVHRTTVYAYYANMDAILAACFVKATNALLTAAEPAFAQDIPFIDRLIDAALAGLEAARSSPVMLSMTASHELARTHRAAERSEAWRVQVVGGLAERFADARPGELRTDVSARTMAEWVVRLCFSLIGDPGSEDSGGDEGLLRKFLPGALKPQDEARDTRRGRATSSSSPYVATESEGFGH